MSKFLGALEGALYLALGITLAAFDIPLWARVLIVVLALGIAIVSNTRVRLGRRDGGTRAEQNRA
ncbi:hypothetical protein [Saccharothrix algeriensis]|uniref:Uncharacterized protein n=1 Tax=Saccharothrix algeriensis TaxID=173560 RepID=A0ABS2S258_9PSEU|nr:hypothetical protein [Saccharothrix algeriensis]MBM7810331.1 hypothetical protein [Saccharothrix algeriensis]